jgi:bifunctional non-homologous end joining protein LigD
MASKPRPRPASAPAPGAVRGLPPANQAPQLCTLVRQSPKGAGWFSEVKFDGYRFLAWKGIDGIRLVTRNGHDWADRLPAVAASIGALKASHIVLDGELVAVRPDGTSSFPELQAALSAGADDRLIFYAFDLLALDGWDLRNCKLLDRKRLLRDVSDWNGQLRYSDHNEGEADVLHQEACRLGLEGIVCKRDEPYRAGRSGGWVKAKCLGREEMVVLGWTLPSGTRTGIGALHLGYYDPEGHLQYAGGAGTGFSDQMLAEWRARLEPLAAPPRRTGAAPGVSRHPRALNVLRSPDQTSRSAANASAPDGPTPSPDPSSAKCDSPDRHTRPYPAGLTQVAPP